MIISYTGKFHFLSSSNTSIIEQTVEPKSGRLVTFTSGSENPHYVERLLSGDRYVLAFWFTCNPDREFEIFLDGKAHLAFKKQTRARLEKQYNDHVSKQKKAEISKVSGKKI